MKLLGVFKKYIIERTYGFYIAALIFFKKCYNQIMDKNEQNKSQTTELSWPNTITSREELDSSLEAGEASGASNYSIDDVFDDVIARNQNG